MRAAAIPFDETWPKDSRHSVLAPLLWAAAVGFTAGFCGYLALAIPALTAG